MNFVLEESRRTLTNFDKLDISSWRAEITKYLQDMNDFQFQEASEVFRNLAAYSARASWIRNQLMQKAARPYVAFRTGEVDPFLAEVERQFKIWSRIVAVTQQEWDMSRG